MKILVITPAKNESQFIQGLIESMVRQSLRPTKWVIVDDGSTDGMADIIRAAMTHHPFIEILSKDTVNETRSGGSKVVRAFNEGYSQFCHLPHDIVVKLDGDLTLPDDYFESIADAFSSDDRLGLCGGYCAIPFEGGWKKERNAPHHVRGALKAYRRTCFEDIGGLTETWNWDGIDTMQILHKGWSIKVLDKEVKHHRPTSAAYDPVSHAFRSGAEAYRTGNDLGITCIRALMKLKVRPYVRCSVEYLNGYINAWWRNEPKVVDPELQTFIRRFAYKRVLKLQ